MSDHDPAKTAKFVEAFNLHGRACESLEKIDDRQLLWLLWKVFFEPADADIFSYTAALISQTEDRLYPEYDGKEVTMTEWGWVTPEGDVVYDRKVYDAIREKDLTQ